MSLDRSLDVRLFLSPGETLPVWNGDLTATWKGDAGISLGVSVDVVGILRISRLRLSLLTGICGSSIDCWVS